LSIIKILILKGGMNEEHLVSLSSAKEVKKAIIELGYKCQSIIVDPKNFKSKIKNYKFDVCFNALHGTFGEDGKVQKILYDKKIKFTHSGIKASKLAFNKHLTKKKLTNKKVILPNYKYIKKRLINKKILEKFLLENGEFIIKPVSSGSSYGIKIISSLKQINIFLDLINKKKSIYKNHKDFLLEKKIQGKELTVAVINEKAKSKAIAVTEILSKNKFFDYNAKYTNGKSKHILPAKIPKRIYKLCLKQSKMIHDKFKCKGVTRSDFIYDNINNRLYFLEINTQPGLTKISLVPEQLKYFKKSFNQIINELILSASQSK
tara:strand:- start:3623 stop:4579 length:957 start_codon:yes stop_codon:yes gene_type:complete